MKNTNKKKSELSELSDLSLKHAIFSCNGARPNSVNIFPCSSELTRQTKTKALTYFVLFFSDKIYLQPCYFCVNFLDVYNVSPFVLLSETISKSEFNNNITPSVFVLDTSPEHQRMGDFFSLFLGFMLYLLYFVISYIKKRKK